MYARSVHYMRRTFAHCSSVSFGSAFDNRWNALEEIVSVSEAFVAHMSETRQSPRDALRGTEE